MINFIGQSLVIKELYGLYMDESQEAVLLKGKYGHGKTTLAEWYASLYGNFIYYDVPPRNFDKVPTMFRTIIMDEVHRVGDREEYLYKLIARHRMVMCTTDTALLSDAFKSRCVILQLEDYTLDEIVQIIRLHVDINYDKALEVAKRSNLNPRVALMLTHRVRRLINIDSLPFSLEAVLYQFDQLGIDEYGLDDRHRAYLALLSNMGIPLSLRTISLTLQLSQDTIRTEIEDLLLRMNKIIITNKGRQLWKK